MRGMHLLAHGLSRMRDPPALRASFDLLLMNVDPDGFPVRNMKLTAHR